MTSFVAAEISTLVVFHVRTYIAICAFAQVHSYNYEIIKTTVLFVTIVAKSLAKFNVVYEI